MTALEYVKYMSKTNQLMGIVDDIELNQDQISELYKELWNEFDYHAMIKSDGVDRINYVLQKVGLSNVKLSKMAKYKTFQQIEVPEGMEVDQVTFKPTTREGTEPSLQILDFLADKINHRITISEGHQGSARWLCLRSDLIDKYRKMAQKEFENWRIDELKAKEDRKGRFTGGNVPFVGNY